MSGTNTGQMAPLLWPIDPSYLITFLVQEQRQPPSDKWFFSELLGGAALWFLLYSGRGGPISAPTKAESDETFGGMWISFQREESAGAAHSYRRNLTFPSRQFGKNTG